MGGLGGDNGHLNHLYEDFNLTLGRLKNLLVLIKNNNVDLYEKVDGQNLSLTYDPRSHRALAARNKTDIKSKGIDLRDVEERYREKPGVLSAFTDAMKVFDKAVSKLTYYQRFQTFDEGMGGIPFVNLEVMSLKNPNVIQYSGNYLVMHGVSRYSKGTANGSSCPETFSAIVDVLSNGVVSTPEGTWMIKGPTKIDLAKTSNREKMEKSIQQILSFMEKHHLEDNDTIKDYVEAQIIIRHLSDTNLPIDIESNFLDRMLDIRGAKSTPSIIKGLDWSRKNALTKLSQSRKKIVRDIIMPLEMIINDFGLALLENSHSSFVENGPDQVDTLRKKTKSAIDKINKANNPSVVEKLEMNLAKLGNNVDESVTSTVEGVVFSDPNNPSANYKITGAFAPMNQILGFVNPSFARSRSSSTKKETLPIFVA
jgi:hypothetical protein